MNQTPISQAFTYGLHGIELDRVSERRVAERHNDAIAATLQPSGRVNQLRQRMGEAMVRAGANIAGNTTATPRTNTGNHPQVDAT